MSNKITILNSSGSSLKQISINDSQLVQGYRSYLGPDLPEFENSKPNYCNIIPRQLTAIDGEYIRRGGPLTPSSSSSTVSQTSYVKSGSSFIIIYGFNLSDYPTAKKVRVEYDIYTSEAIINTNSTISKITIEVIISPEEFLNPINILQLGDSEILSLKTRLNKSNSDIMNAREYHISIPDALYSKDGKYMGNKVSSTSAITNKYSQIFSNRFIINEIQ